MCTSGHERSCGVSWKAGFDVGSFCHSWMEGDVFLIQLAAPASKGSLVNGIKLHLSISTLRAFEMTAAVSGLPTALVPHGLHPPLSCRATK